MALIKCPECGNEVSEKATACPKCGHPIAEEQSSPQQTTTHGIPQQGDGKATNRFKTGSIVGLIGGIGMILFFVYGTINGQASQSAGQSATITVKENPMLDFGVLVVMVATVFFLAALIAGNKMSKPVKIAVSVIALLLASGGLISLFFYFNLFAICALFLFLWEPILELVGAIMMVSGAMKSDA